MTNGPNVKKDMEDNARHLRHLKQNAQTPIEKLKNDKLGRVLTSEELSAVKWWVPIIKAPSLVDIAIRNIVAGADNDEIEYILHEFRTHANDIKWIERKKQLHRMMEQVNKRNMLRQLPHRRW